MFIKELYWNEIALNRAQFCTSFMCPKHSTNDTSGFYTVYF